MAVLCVFPELHVGPCLFLLKTAVNASLKADTPSVSRNHPSPLMLDQRKQEATNFLCDFLFVTVNVAAKCLQDVKISNIRPVVSKGSFW